MFSFTLPLTSALDGVGGQRHAPASLPPGKTRYPLYRRLGGPQGRSGRVRKILPPHRDSIPDIYVYIIMQLLLIQISPVSCYFLPLMVKYFPQHPVYGPPQSVLLPELRPCLILINETGSF